MPLAAKEKSMVEDSLLVRVAVLAALVVPTGTVPNGSVAGLMDSARVPVPARATVCGESGALSVMATEPLTPPGTAGWAPTHGGNWAWSVSEIALGARAARAA